jgi:ChrB-like protein
MATDWLLCSYRLPREPSRLRLAIWRRLKRLGAVVLHDSLWVLPSDAKTREDVDWLAEEIEEKGGSALLWQAKSLPTGQDASLIEDFKADAESRYAAIADSARKLERGAERRVSRVALERILVQLRGLERTLRLERRRDHFRAAGRREAEEAVTGSADRIRSRLAETVTRRRQHALGH